MRLKRFAYEVLKTNKIINKNENIQLRIACKSKIQFV